MTDTRASRRCCWHFAARRSRDLRLLSTLGAIGSDVRFADRRTHGCRHRRQGSAAYVSRCPGTRRKRAAGASHDPNIGGDGVASDNSGMFRLVPSAFRSADVRLPLVAARGHPSQLSRRPCCICSSPARSRPHPPNSCPDSIDGRVDRRSSTLACHPSNARVLPLRWLQMQHSTWRTTSNAPWRRRPSSGSYNLGPLTIDRLEDTEAALEEVGYPAVIKPTASHGLPTPTSRFESPRRPCSTCLKHSPTCNNSMRSGAQPRLCSSWPPARARQ